ncbi:MAG: hypothetical protein HYY45_06835 [Deltaproteobacteria bacterium]|nr:hypothetical protein [Deltaproteobacteria bacterium]
MAKTKFKLVRLEADENAELEATAARLGLSVAEILRRSVRISLPQLKKLSALGVRQADRKAARR